MRLSLRSKIVLYVLALHAVLAGAAVVVLLERPAFLFAVEIVFAISVVISVRLVRAIFVPLDLIQTGAELIAERDFTSRFVPMGQPEMDNLIDVYNRMIDRLRDERLAAEEQHQLLQKIVDAAPAGIVICDFDGDVELANPAAKRLLGCHSDAAISQPLRDGAPPHPAFGHLLPAHRGEKALDPAMRKVQDPSPLVRGEGARRADEGLFSSHIRLRLPDMAAGESRLISGIGSRRLKISRGSFRDRGFAKGFYVIEEMTEELRISEKSAYEKLIRMMSHEVNNSVGAVRSLLESSLQYAPQVGEADRADFTSALTIASARIDALNRFMAAFADVVRIPPPSRSPTRIAELVERVAALLRPELSERAIRVELDLADRGIYDADAGQIEQVVLNIFRNAIDAVHRDGVIRAALREGVLTVTDSGPGITESIRSELFTPFFTTKRDGRGLGLTIVHEILANHGFTFSLENAEGGGARFSILFSSAAA